MHGTARRCLAACRWPAAPLRASPPVLARDLPGTSATPPTTPSTRLRKGIADVKGPQLTLQHFLLRSQVISLYRRFLRTTRDIPHLEARIETIEWIRSDFDRRRLETDLVAIRDYLQLGQLQLKQMQGPFTLSNPNGDFVKLRGRRSSG